MGKTKLLKRGLIAGLLSTLVFTGGCVTPGATGGQGGGSWTPIIFLGLLFAVFYFLLIRPQRKRQKEHQQMVEELKRGDKVVTSGGIYGQIESISEESVVLKIESGTTIRIARGSVSGKREK